MFFPELGINQMESFIPSVEAIFNERAKDPVLLVRGVEKSANMTRRETAFGFHMSPH
jgi:hypothetical protein